MEPHRIYSMIASRRKELGLSQQELGRRAGLRREKSAGLNAKESI